MNAETVEKKVISSCAGRLVADGWQAVGVQQVQELLTLPRVVVSAEEAPENDLEQTGVTPYTVKIQLAIDATQSGADQRLMDAVEEIRKGLNSWKLWNPNQCVVLGLTMGNTNRSNGDGLFAYDCDCVIYCV